MSDNNPIKAFRSEMVYLITFAGMIGALFIAYNSITNQLASIQTTIANFNEQVTDIKSTVRANSLDINALTNRVSILESKK